VKIKYDQGFPCCLVFSYCLIRIFRLFRFSICGFE